MNKSAEILIRPTYDTLSRELDHDPSDSGDPDKADPIAFEQGFRTEARLVEPGEAFEIARGWEGCEGMTQAFKADWGLRPGRYSYDGKDVKLIDLFDDGVHIDLGSDDE